MSKTSRASVSSSVHNEAVPSFLTLKNQHIFALIFLFLLPVFLVPEVFFGGKKFFAHDTIQWRAAAETIIQDRETYNEEPLWAPNMFSGMPAFLISYKRVVPLIDDALGIFLKGIFPAAPFWVALGGAYVMFFLFGLRPFVAAAGSVALSFTTYIPIIIGAGHNTKFQAYAYIPWIIASYLLFKKGDKKLLALASLALSLNLELRAAHPQITYYFGLLIAGWWTFDTFQAYKEKTLPQWLKNTGLILVPGVVLALLANIQPYWGIAEYSPFSIRGGSAASGTSGAGLDENYAFAWSQGWFELLTLIIPGIMGGSSATGYWGPKSVTSGPHYLGILTFIFAIAGIWFSKRKEKNVFLVGGIIALFLSLGENFTLLNGLFFSYFPLFNKFRTPEMWLIVTVFSGSILMAFGIEAILEKIQEGKQSLKTIALPLAAGLIVVLGLWIGSRSGMSFQRENEVDQIANQVAAQYGRTPDDKQLRAQIASVIQKQYVPQRQEVAKSDTTRALMLAGIALLFVFLTFRKTISVVWVAPVLLLITAFDMLQIGRRYMAVEGMISKEVEYEDYFNRLKTPVISFVVENGKSPEGWSYRALPLDENPFNNAVPAYFYPTVGGYTGAKMSIYQDVLSESFYTELGLNKGLLNMLNVKYITLTQPQQVPGFNFVFVDKPENVKEGSGAVLENDNVLPKAWFVDSVYTVETAANALQELKQFNPAKTAFIPHIVDFSAKKDSSATAVVTKYAPREINLKTKNAENGYLVLSEIYYPAGWKAFVDGTETTIHQTNYILRGIEIPAGEHEVSFQFNPESHKISSAISLVLNGIIVLLVGFAVFTTVKRG